MKIAVLVSGAFHSKYKGCEILPEYNKTFREKFPDAEFFYATWDKFEYEVRAHMPDIECLYFKEPVMHYHPYLDIDKKDAISNLYTKSVMRYKKAPKDKIEWTKHHTKQILIHSRLMETLPKEYDIIVRLRWDTYMYHAADFSTHIQDAYNNRVVYGYCTDLNLGFGIEKNMEESRNPEKYKVLLNDAMIIHPYDALSTANVEKLHEAKKLHPAEHGWYQVLCKIPNLQHKNISGLISNNKFGHPDEKGA